MPMTLQGQSPLTIHTRTFETTFLSFVSEKEAIDVFESVKELTVASEYIIYVLMSPPKHAGTDHTIGSFGRTALCILLRSKSPISSLERMVHILSS